MRVVSNCLAIAVGKRPISKGWGSFYGTNLERIIGYCSISISLSVFVNSERKNIENSSEENE